LLISKEKSEMTTLSSFTNLKERSDGNNVSKEFLKS
jgi:hypothetical protein